MPERSPLTEHSLAAAAAALAAGDPALGEILARYGAPPLWSREPGFPTLVRIILEQQVSLASAAAAFERLVGAVKVLTPAALLTLDDAALKAVGFSRQKARYVRGLATLVLDGGLDLEGLAEQDDDTVRQALKQVVGIGDWTADIYLLMALRRPDTFPASDLALQVAARQVLGLAGRPLTGELASLAERWRPYRAVAARMLWHAYLSR